MSVNIRGITRLVIGGIVILIVFVRVGIRFCVGACVRSGICFIAETDSAAARTAVTA